MSLLKNVISKIVKPFGHICNVSFQTGVFPNKMKTAKVIPLNNSEKCHNFKKCYTDKLLNSCVLESQTICKNVK